MISSINVYQKLLDRLSNYNESCFGNLYGIFVENSLTILGLQIDCNEYFDLSLSFPTEIDKCGIIQIENNEYFDVSLIKKKLSDIDITDNPVFLHFQLNKEFTVYCYINDELKKLQYNIINEDELFKDFCYVRIKGNLNLICELTYDSIKECFLNKKNLILSDIIAFNIHNTNIYLTSGNSELKDNLKKIQSLIEETHIEGTKYNKKNKSKLNILQINLYKKMTKENQLINDNDHAPLCVLNKKQCKTLHLNLKIDSIAMIQKQSIITLLYDIFVEAVIRNLRLYEKSILEHIENLSIPQINHFYPNQLGHFISFVYQKKQTENDLISKRLTIHKELLLPITQPLLRRSNSYIFMNEGQPTTILMNPHEGVKLSNNNGKIVLVQGKYLYYHYCQDNIDDNGWGCAYRSLQTLISWFKLQGYTDKNVPTFKDIQKCLINIGDKSVNFLDSKQWIGSTEVNFVLTALINITCKIIFVRSGDEMNIVGPQLIDHFENHGSPIMIGGGSLAHTILGVDYNSDTGDLKFLILDPHYVGPEDLKTIQNKGWCGWKNCDFWKKNSYYNMCLPLVPKMV